MNELNIDNYHQSGNLVKHDTITNYELVQLFFVCLLPLLSGINDIIDQVISIFVCCVLIANFNKDAFFYYFPVLMIFEAQFLLPFGLGSVTKVYFSLIILKLLINIKGIGRIKKIYLCFSIPLLLLELYRISDGIYNISIITNVFMISIIHSRIIKSPRMLVTELIYLSVAIFFSGVYGLVKGNYLNAAVLSERSYFHFTRFSGTINDPNYSSMLFNLGIFSLISCNIRRYRIIKMMMIAVLYIFLLMTVSIQGITGNILCLTLYFIVSKNKKIKVRNLQIFVLCIIIIVVIFNSNWSIIQPYKLRVNSILDNEKDLSRMTSGRFTLLKNYLSFFVETSFIQKLIGGTLIISNAITKENFVKLAGGVSHNSYIDMLFEVGVIGAIWITSCFLYSLIRYLKLYMKTHEKVYLGIIFIKLFLLYMALGLSIFPYRYFLYIYLL